MTGQANLKRASRAKRHATQRRLVKALWAAKRLIAENEGIYPSNGGRLSEAELCRLAGIRPALLRGRAHATTTLVSMKRKLARVLAGTPRGKRARRQAHYGGVSRWKAKHQEAVDRLCVVERELDERGTRVAAVEAERDSYRDERDALSVKVEELERRLAERDAPTSGDIDKLVAVLAAKLRSAAP